MILRWPKFDADKPIRSCCFVSLAYTSVPVLAGLIASAALGAFASAQPVEGAGGGLVIGFIIAPILFLAGVPWSVMAAYDNDLPVVLQFALMGAGALLNALLLGFAIGLVRAVRRTG
jgi:hypothetical protein